MYTIFQSLAFFAAAVILHAICVRTTQAFSRIVLFMIVGSICGTGLLAFIFYSSGPSITLVASAVTYGFACELYIFLFTLVANSVSLGILVRLREKPLKAEQISALYDPEAMVQRRFEQLSASGLIDTDGKKYLATRKGEAVMQSMCKLRRFFGHPEIS